MRITCFVLACLATACGDDLRPPTPGVPGYAVLTLTFEEEYCNGSGLDTNLNEVFESELWSRRSELDPEAVDIDLFPEAGLSAQFRGVRIEPDGRFEAWSHYAFVRNGQALAPAFFHLQGYATATGFHARLAMYFSEGPTNDLASPDCRYVYRISDR